MPPPSSRAGNAVGVFGRLQPDSPSSMQSRTPLSTPSACRPSSLSHTSRQPAARQWHLLRSKCAAAHSLVTALLLLLLAESCLLQPAAAVSVAFQNCLADYYLNHENPVYLQWVPLHVDASFDTENATHGLVVTMYGNVTGTLTSETLPAWNSSDWADDSFLDGKILEKPEPNSPNPKLTTLHSKINVLTYQVWDHDTNFCNSSLFNGNCPLAPVFNTSVISLADLPAATMANDFYSTYAFTSFSATFIIRYGNDEVTTVGCVSATVTPHLGSLGWLVGFLPLMVLVAVGFATVFAGIYSPWGSTNIFHWTSNYGRDPDLLRLVTPGFGDCLQYIQYVVLTGSLTLAYPGFYQPIVSHGAWSSLMFNESFVSKSPGMQSVVDGIYYTNGSYGLQNTAQLIGMARADDIWAGMVVWLMAIIGSALVLFQLGFGLQWLYRFIHRIPEEDLRSKNWPFSVGNVIRIVFNYFLLPLVALSAFQLVVASESPAYTVALAALTLFVVIVFASWLLRLIISTKPRAVLFDDLPTLLFYGPLYNAYSDEAAAYALTPIFLTLVRGIAIGAVQPAGIAQIVLLAICEVIQILTLHAFRPYHSQSSMNAYHTLFSLVRFITIMLMIAFIPALGLTEGTKGWIGYVILVIHAGVLILGFFLNAIQTVLEVIARIAGAGGDDITGQTRGGLSKIFGMRQLSRRMPRRSVGIISRQSQLSSSAMLYSDEVTKAGYAAMPGGRLRSESAGSIGVLMAGKPGQRSSSALDNLSLDGPMLAPGSRQLDSGESAFTPTTIGEASNFSFLPSPGANHPTRGMSSVPGVTSAGGEITGPYYRPPRRARRATLERDTVSSPADRTRGSWASSDWTQRAAVHSGAPSTREIEGGDGAENDQGSSGAVGAPGGEADSSAEPADGGMNFTPPPIISPRTDYSTREVDFYYGVRGERLNSDAPGRKLGTGPADPTGPMSSAAGWLRGFLGGKSKEKGKGFEVVRSARMPPAMMARGGDYEDEGPPPGIPVAMDVIRHGPIESDDEDTVKGQSKNGRKRHSRSQSAMGIQGKLGTSELLDAEGNPRDEDATSDTSETSVTSETNEISKAGRAGRASDGENTSVDEAVSIEPTGLVSDRPPSLPQIDIGGSIHIPSRLPSRHHSKASGYTSDSQRSQSRDARGEVVLLNLPTVPRKSSRRSGSWSNREAPFSLAPPPTSAEVAAARQAAYERSQSGSSRDRRHSPAPSSAATTTVGEFSQVALDNDRAPSEHVGSRSDGYVQQGSISRIESQQSGLLEHSTEVVETK